MTKREIIAGGGAAALLVRSIDWSATPLGALESWPTRVTAAVEVALASGFPTSVLLGADPSSALVIYNDATIALMGQKHPAAMGRRGRDVWPENWDFVEWALRQVWQRGEPVMGKDILFHIDRGGFVEETYVSLSWSPIRGDEGQVCGAFVCTIDTTNVVLGERREHALRLIAEGLRDARTEAELFGAVSRTLAWAGKDVVFGLLYELDPVRERAVLRASAGLAMAPDPLCEVDLRNGGPFEIPKVLAERKMRLVQIADMGLPLLAALSGPPRLSAVVPLMSSPDECPHAVLVIGLRPMRARDEARSTFVLAVAREIAAAFTRVRSLEEGRRRADALAEIERAKTRFLTEVSHELRTPLTLIIGPLEDLLSVDGLGPAAREALRGVRCNAYRLLRYVNALLEFARVDARCASMAFEPVDLGAFTRDIAREFEPACAWAGVRLSMEGPALPAPVFVVPSMWEQIVSNLLSNALKFTFEGEIAVSLQIASNRAVLTVRDTGIGIAEDALPHVFERFYRVPRVHARTSEGMGIGLALVKELAELHGGTVSASSAVGRGSSFVVEIPCGVAHLPKDRVCATRLELRQPMRDVAPFVEDALGWVGGSPAGAVEPAPAGADRVVLVEGDEELRGYLIRLLGASYHVDAVASGADALAVARERSPDLVLADALMPDLDASALVRALRDDPRTSEIPVIVLSARAGEDIGPHLAGADDYLVKPFSAAELRARVRTQIDLSRTRREACQSRLKDTFLGLASHELRTPLTCLKLNVQLAQRDIERIEPRLATRLAGLNRSIDRMTRLVNELLSVAAITGGKLSLREARCDLVEICKGAASEQSQATRRPLTLHLPEGPVPVVVDEDRTAEVVGNLLANAIKYSAAEEPVVLALEAKNGEAIVTVRDKGPGIPKDALQRVFDRFYRVPGASVHGSYAGLGLGLFLSKAIVEQQSGRIWVDSEVGRGSAFSFSLPLAA